MFVYDDKQMNIDLYLFELSFLSLRFCILVSVHYALLFFFKLNTWTTMLVRPSDKLRKTELLLNKHANPQQPKRSIMQSQ